MIGPNEQHFNFGTRPNSGISPVTQKNRVDESNLAVFLDNQIRVYCENRRMAERDWDLANRAYRNLDEPSSGDDIFEELFTEKMRFGLPFAATQTTVAALVPRKPGFRVKGSTIEGVSYASLCQILLNRKWSSDKLQWQCGKLVMSGKHYGLMVGQVVCETDYDAFEKRMEKTEAEETRRAQLPAEDQHIEDLVDGLVNEEIASVDAIKEPMMFRTEVDHLIYRDQVGTRVINPRHYVADPEAKDFVYGPRWEGRVYQASIRDIRKAKRFKATARTKVAPTRKKRRPNSVLDYGTAGKSSRMVPEEFQVADLVEIFWYDDPDYRDSFGSMITIALDPPLLLERRPNPYGARPFVVEEWNGDLETPFPQTDINAWHDIWRAAKEVLYRLIRQARKAPNTTICYDEESSLSNDNLQGVLDNDDGGLVPLPLGGRDINQAMKELAHRPMSGEFANVITFLIDMIRLVEGLSPNQFGGGALKSETSATEAGEIAQFSRARLDVKANALNRFLGRMGKLVLQSMFRFFDFDEIARTVGAELASRNVDVIKAKGGSDQDIDVEVDPYSMAPDSFQARFQRLQALVATIIQHPILLQTNNTDALVQEANETFKMDTGEDMFVALDDARVLLNQIMLQAGQGQGGGRPSPPRSPGESGGTL